MLLKYPGAGKQGAGSLAYEKPFPQAQRGLLILAHPLDIVNLGQQIRVLLGLGGPLLLFPGVLGDLLLVLGQGVPVLHNLGQGRRLVHLVLHPHHLKNLLLLFLGEVHDVFDADAKL